VDHEQSNRRSHQRGGEMSKYRYNKFSYHHLNGLQSYLANRIDKLEGIIRVAQDEIKGLKAIGERLETTRKKCKKCNGSGLEYYQGALSVKSTSCDNCKGSGETP
jgi:DnaJ-class molecular chaperone